LDEYVDSDGYQYTDVDRHLDANGHEHPKFHPDLYPDADLDEYLDSDDYQHTD
jgi:hypothetical protein